MAVLEWLSSHGGSCFPLIEPRMVIGRLAQCEILLDCKHVSRRHACIHRENDAFLIVDLGSRNGTRVNGTKISGRQALNDGDSLQIDKEQLLFRLDDPVPAIESASEVMGTLFVESGSAVQGQSRPEDRLQAVMDVSHSLTGSVSEDQILENLLRSLLSVFSQADRGLVLMPRRDGDIHLRSYRCQKDRTFPATISRSVARQVLKNSEAILSYDVAEDTRFDASTSLQESNIRSMLCAPLPSRDGESLGVVQIDRLSEGMPFAMEDLELLAAVSTFAAQALENSRLHTAFLKSQLQEQELLVAAELQRLLVPRKLPQAPGYQIESDYQPAVELSGDCLDSFALPDGRIAMAIGDVAGKGVGAALLMARVGAAIRLSFEDSDDPAAILERTNRLLVAQETSRFVTCVVMLLDPARRVLSIASAGHCPTLLQQSSGMSDIPDSDISGPPLGMVPDLNVSTQTVQLQPGDTLLAYTDGLTEAQTSNGELYGLERVRDITRQHASDPKDLIRAVADDARRFAGNAAQSDDLTLLMLHCQK